MTAGAYLRGLLLVCVMLVPVAAGSVAARRRLVPAWSGAPARLVEVILAASALLILGELLGAVGLYRLVPVVATCVVAGIAGTVALLRRCGPTRPEAATRPLGHPFPGGARLAGAVAGLGLVGVASLWLARTLAAYDQGILALDALSYHLPFAARFVQTGWVTRLHFVDPNEVIAFHPASSELLHGLAMLAFHRDLLSPLFNLVWLAVALLAAWCIGRRRGAGPASVLLVAAVMSGRLMISVEAGTALNDVMGVAALLAAAALLLEGEWGATSVFVAGLAAGLAVGTKLTLLGPVAVLVAAIIAFAPAARRAPAVALFTAAGATTGSFWYLRNLFRVGNPVPSLRLPGLPSPSAQLTHQVGQSVIHYAGDTHVWRVYFGPALSAFLGRQWPLLVAVVVTGAALAAVRGSTRIHRMLGVVALGGLAVYLVTPTGAGGTAGAPVLFGYNLRYAMPAMALGGALLPVVSPFTARRARWVAVALGAGLLLADLVASGVWPPAHRRVVAAAAAAGAAGVIAVSAAGARHRPTRLEMKTPLRLVLAGGTALAAVLAAGIGWRVQRHYFRLRYTSPTVYAVSPAHVWARQASHTRIAMAGFAQQFPLYGPDLSNVVQWVGSFGPHRDFRPSPDCRQWRTAVNEGHYRFVVTSPTFKGQPEPLEAFWTRSDPAAVEILHQGSASVFRLTGPLDPGRCPNPEAPG